MVPFEVIYALFRAAIRPHLDSGSSGLDGYEGNGQRCRGPLQKSLQRHLRLPGIPIRVKSALNAD